jgi:hypothetical protein
LGFEIVGGVYHIKIEASIKNKKAAGTSPAAKDVPCAISD